VISGQDHNGIVLSSINAFNNRIEQNYIGLNRNGDDDEANTEDGVKLIQEANHNFISNNWISGNTLSGIEVSATTSGNEISGNSIGPDRNGNVAIPNGKAGLVLSGRFNNVHNNVLSGNTVAGI